MKKFFIKTASLIFALLMILPLASCALVEYREYGAGRETSSESSSVGNWASSDVFDSSSSESEPSPPPKPKVITIAAAGDNLIHESVYLDAAKRASAGKEYDFTPMYAGIADVIKSADIAMVNHETPLAGREFGYSGYPNFNSPREASEALLELGFDVIGIANNHALDKGTAGLKSTMDYLDTLPVTSIGAYRSEADMYTARVVEVEGCRIGFVAFSYGWYNTNTMDPSYGLIIPSMTDDAVITRWVADQKSKCDFLIVSVHWGDEGSFAPNDSQKKAARLMAEAGADAIIGHHSHTVQPVEWIYTSDGSRTLCIYSLGNMISTMLYGYYMVGGIAVITLTENDEGKFEITDALYNPIVTHYSMNRDALQVYLLEDYTENLAKAHGCTLNSPEFSLATAKSYVKNTISAEFLPDYLK